MPNTLFAFEDVFHRSIHSDVFQFGSTFPNSDHRIAMTYMRKTVLYCQCKDILRKIWGFASIYAMILGVTSVATGTDKHSGIWYAPT